MSGENFNSPDGLPENFRGLSASDLLIIVFASKSIKKLEDIRHEVMQRLFTRDLDDDEKDLLASIDLQIEKLREPERREVELLSQKAKEQAEKSRTLIAFWALSQRYEENELDAQLRIEEDARIALFQRREE